MKSPKYVIIIFHEVKMLPGSTVTAMNNVLIQLNVVQNREIMLLLFKCCFKPVLNWANVSSRT